MNAEVHAMFAQSHDLLDAAEQLRMAAVEMERLALQFRLEADRLDPPLPASKPDMYRGEPIWHLPNGSYHLDIGGTFPTIEEARTEIDDWLKAVENERLDPFYQPRQL